MTMKKTGGFTLIEMLVVLGLFGILTAVAFSGYRQQTIRTKRTECRSALVKAMQQEERYFSQNNTYIAFDRTNPNADAQRFKWFSGESATASSCELRAFVPCETPPDNDIKSCIKVVAMPGTPNVNTAYRDPDCQTLTLDSRGQKGIEKYSGIDPTDTRANCWK